MFKKFLLIVAMIFMSTSVYAADLQLNDDWQTAGVTGLVLQSGESNNAFSGGLFYGPIANVKTDSGKNIIGLGGLIGNLKSDDTGTIKGAIGVTAVTAFDNMIQASIVGDPTDFKWLNPDSYMLAITVDGIKAAKQLGSGMSIVFGWIVP